MRFFNSKPEQTLNAFRKSIKSFPTSKLDTQRKISILISCPFQ